MTTTKHSLLLVRHAKSDWTGSASDIDRPLAERGRAEAPLAGQWLASHGGRIDLVIVSPARRARETWELVRAQLASAPPARVDDRVYLASAELLLDVVREVPDEVRTVLLVGHNPGMERLASLVAGTDVVMRTSGIAEIGVEAPWAELDATSAVLRAAGRSDRHDLS